MNRPNVTAFSTCAQRIERMSGARRPRQEAVRQQQGQHTGWHLQREQPGPGQHRHDRRSHRRPRGGRTGDHQRVEPDPPSERLTGIDEAHQRTVHAHDAGAAEALHHAADHQHRQRWRQRTDQRCRGVNHQSPDVDSTMTIDVAHRGERQQRHRYRELVGVHHPDRRGRCRTQVVCDGRQRDVGDRGHQHRHGDRDGDCEHRTPPLARRQSVGYLQVACPHPAHAVPCVLDPLPLRQQAGALWRYTKPQWISYNARVWSCPNGSMPTAI